MDFSKKMEYLEKIKQICLSYKRDEVSIKDFQFNLLTALASTPDVPDENSNKIEALVRDADNEIEMIIYATADFEKAKKIADNLVYEIGLIEK